MQDLYGEIERQRQACEKIIASKDKLIMEIKTELKKKDDEFVKTLKRQAEDVDTLLQYMSRQFVEMQNAFKEELDEIENAFLQVRRLCIIVTIAQLKLTSHGNGMKHVSMHHSILAAVHNAPCCYNDSHCPPPPPNPSPPPCPTHTLNTKLTPSTHTHMLSLLPCTTSPAGALRPA